MNFRTEISILPQKNKITHDDPIVMLGSCFTDNIGQELERDGFKVTHNPLGPLYNAASITNAVIRSLSGKPYAIEDLTKDDADLYHCLDFASRYVNADADKLLQTLNSDIRNLKLAIEQASVLILTLGTAYVYEWHESSRIVGNCHKFPASNFLRFRQNVGEIAGYLRNVLAVLPPNINHVIFTVSPIRHTADGLHDNQLSKSMLLLAIDKIMEVETDGLSQQIEYFPSYEIMMDDLRDYRFYASDMKHPSEVAVEYIYQCFGRAYFSNNTSEKAKACRKEWLRSQHRQIINS